MLAAVDRGRAVARVRVEGIPYQIERVLRVVEGTFALAGEDAGEYLERGAEARGHGNEPKAGASREPAFDGGLGGCAGCDERAVD